MQIEVGKKYVNRLGNVRGPMKVTASHPDRFTDEMGNWYGADGHYWQQRPDCQFSLVAESLDGQSTRSEPDPERP